DLVYSAFGHAGQKCSAASLGIMVGSTYDSERYRRQLIDAASSMVVDWPSNLASTMGPLTEDPSDKLRRALTSLEPGESWLLEPKQLDDSGRLWSPGIKDGVKPGSFFHLTEVFGPVLGLMHAKDLDEAIEFQNAVDFGLTGGIHSLDPEEVATWLDRVEVGNAYVNRGITGAIVRRQSFGGWKQSSVGLGSKAGGPNYLMLFGHFADSGNQDLEAAKADDKRWLEAEFGAAKDHTGLRAEANIFRYRPRPVTLRVTAEASLFDLERSLHAAATVDSPVQLSVAEDVPAEVKIAVTNAGVPARTETAAEFAEMVGQGRYDDTVGARIRVLGRFEDELLAAAAPRPEVAIIDEPVTTSGRVELRYYVQEQAVSMTLHRFGNPSRDFHELAAELKG
ncbi:MAG TPA: aldehyde dehydrogenase family protein, partial [Brevibacterium epidermidis]|nr:aldehyde dehydrogenase family protein [Brevibacterium epidermidis]